MNTHRLFQKDCHDILRTDFKNGRISRRDFLRTSAMIGLGSAVAGTGAGRALAQEQGEIVLSNFGGDAINAYQTAWGQPFAEESGIAVNIDGSGPLVGNIRKMVDERNVIWDVVDSADYYALQLGEEYLMPIDYSVIDPAKLYDWNKMERGSGSYTFSNVLAYDSSKFDEAPTGWADFFDLEKFPGKRLLYKWFDSQPEAFMMAAGRSMDEIYPIDMDLVVDMLESLGDNLILWDSGGMSQQLFLDEEVVMGNIWNTRARVLNRDTEGRVKWIWNQQIVSPGIWTVPIGAPNPEGAMKFMASTLVPERQIALLDMLGNGPANPAAAPMLTDEQRAIDPTSHIAEGLVHDAQWYADNYENEMYTWLDAVGS